MVTCMGIWVAMGVSAPQLVYGSTGAVTADARGVINGFHLTYGLRSELFAQAYGLCAQTYLAVSNRDGQCSSCLDT